MDSSIKPILTVSTMASSQTVDGTAYSPVTIDPSSKNLLVKSDDELKPKTLGARKKIEEYSVERVHSSPLHKKIVDQLLCTQSDLDVDVVSYQTMIDSLKFSGIDTWEQVESLNLRIVPPGPVFHTWWAKYGTGIFDGSNNPEHIKGLNYVRRIEEQAEKLKQWDVPVFIVYLERDMQESELIKMRTLFKKHENIIMLSLEKDLDFLSDCKYCLETNSSQLIDDVRCVICKEFPFVLSAVKNKAKEESKFEYIKRLELMKGKSIIYSDIDNTFIRRPLYQIAANGFRLGSVVSNRFRFVNSFHSDHVPSRIARHINYFLHEGFYCEKMQRFNSDYLLKSADSLYEYLSSGEAFDSYKEMAGSLDLNKCSIFGNDIGYIIMDQKALDRGEKLFTGLSGLEWINAFENRQPLDFRVENLLGLQQIKQLHYGRDGTWRHEPPPR
ncbi:MULTISPECIES: hypothetical protein [unclassified Endozoicomonas]|uniref:hypothetical protein n=1 Tax=unclassified Endozoicomonas TaxID=2644528 RepID=UPI0021475E87|nr:MULTISPECIES: hypothetical protein [unclassified Endozoicomonas]